MSKVTFNENGYLIDGNPKWLLSGEMHYFKMTKGDWRRRLVQLKCAGFNTVSVYMPWNYHELSEGEWDFSGDRDVEYFLQQAAEIGLYVVARPGPYICNEWQAGGLPAWLSSTPDIRLRTKDPIYLSYVDKWWEKIAPLIAKYQLGKEGTIILAQVENEYGHYGEYQEPDYVYHLRDGLQKFGVEVPIINCDSFIQFARLKPGIYDGINMCCNFGGDGLRTLQRARGLQAKAPLFVTEYWIAAFDWWGRNGSAIYDDDRSLNGALEIAAGGAGGLTAFVFAGGAHFGYWHGCSICSDANFMTTLYGPGAPILDDGQFSGKYQLFKNKLSPLCLESLAGAGMPEISENSPGMKKAVRKNKDTEFTFYLNQSDEQLEIADNEKDQACVDMSIPAGSVEWTVSNLPLAEGLVLKNSNLKLFLAEPDLVMYGTAGSNYHINLEADGQASTLSGQVPANNEPELKSVGEYKILITNDQNISKCWKIAIPGAPETIIGGPDRIEDVKAENGSLKLKVSANEKAPVWKLEAAGIVSETPEYQGKPESTSIALSQVKCSSDFPESAPDFDDSSWYQADTPQPMSKFGHGNGHAWYRTTITVKDEGPQIIYFSGADDRALVFVDGNFLGHRGVGTNKGWHLMPSLQPGEHSLSMLVENLGMINSGAEFDIPLGEPKGLYGPVWLNGKEISGWKMRTGIKASETLDFWYKPGPDNFSTPEEENLKGPVWLKASFSMPENFDGSVRLNFGEAAGKGSAWLNGHNLGRYWKLGPQQSLWLPLSWLKKDNELVILEEEKITPSEISVSLKSFGYSAEISI
jgi:hypothetical protein